jgi:Domain of unknown function (DUF4159)
MEAGVLKLCPQGLFRRDMQVESRPSNSFSLSLRSFLIAALIPMTWLFAADSPTLPAKNSPAAFRFARLRYPGGIPDYIKNWYTDYPAMDDHLTLLLGRLTGIDVGQPALIDTSSSEIFEYPLVYSVEPEQMFLQKKDITNLREYLARGGLWFADDFHGDEEFDRFFEQVQQVLPESTPVELDISHPLFHCFYDISKIIQVTNNGIAKCRECEQWENGPSGKVPKMLAVFDERGRISILMAWNTDLGDGLEWADDPDYPSNYSKFAFKFLTNVIVYTMSH